MAEIAVVNPSLNFMGGSQRVCLEVIRALRQGGHRVTLITVDAPDWGRLRELFGEQDRPDREISLLRGVDVSALRMGLGLAATYALRFMRLLHKLRGGFDLVVNTFGEFEPMNIPADAAYFGAPPFSMSHLYPWASPYLLKSRLVRCAYCFIARHLRLFGPGNGLMVLANSTLTKEALLRLYGQRVMVEVVNPPHSFEGSLGPGDPGSRHNSVVTISRFSHGKNLELLPRIALASKGWSFTVIGTATAASQSVLGKISTETTRLNLGGRLRLEPNAPAHAVAKALSESKAYLHLMENEPFGIAIVEAMASGCVPIIPTSCGAWRDVLESRQGYYGYGYGRYMEVPSYLAKLEDEDTYLELARRAVERAKQFGAESFRRKILEALSRHPKMRSKA